jgi:hypothetical protein
LFTLYGEIFWVPFSGPSFGVLVPSSQRVFLPLALLAFLPLALLAFLPLALLAFLPLRLLLLVGVDNVF